jgi:hypothetical protein
MTMTLKWKKMDTDNLMSIGGRFVIHPVFGGGYRITDTVRHLTVVLDTVKQCKAWANGRFTG